MGKLSSKREKSVNCDATSYPDVSNAIPTVKPVQEPNIYQEIIDNWQETPETLPEKAPEPNPEGKN
ncbi:hypothetical protein [Treponema saccharophilum]|uniref:hypothetical protein n=1 Tax=Treponema saccharophilum TaxID=165 RepID=UPI001146905B|nr:hypothetical protein [Treponema saccharophilum]